MKIACFFLRYSNYGTICNYYAEYPRIYSQNFVFANASLIIQIHFKIYKYYLHS